MSGTVIQWPQKTRELHNHHFDSTIWNDFKFRDDDIVIGTYGKSGTTWVQQIVSQLIFSGAEGLEVAEMSPWLDLRVPPKAVKLQAVEAQTHRRFVKTHLPVDALVFSPQAKYLYIGRDGRDVIWSMYNHHACANDDWYRALNATVEGQSTAHYLMDQLGGSQVTVSRLAHGVPIGGELDYLDEGTLAAAVKARKVM